MLGSTHAKLQILENTNQTSLAAGFFEPSVHHLSQKPAAPGKSYMHQVVCHKVGVLRHGTPALEARPQLPPFVEGLGTAVMLLRPRETMVEEL